MIILGRLDSIVPLAGVSLGVVIFDYLFWGFGFLRMGTTANISNFSGANQTKEIREFLGKTIVLAFAIGIIILFFSYPIWKLASNILIGSPEVLIYAKQYFWGRIITSPFILSIYVMWGALLGSKQVKKVLFYTLLMNIVNISLSSYFVLFLGWESFGVGLATALADIILFILILADLLKMNFVEKFSIPVKNDFIQLFKANKDLMIRTLLLILFFSVFTNFSSSFSEITLVSNSILQKIFIVCAYFFDGLAYTFEIVVGNLNGAKKIKEIKSVIKKGSLITIFMIFLALIILIIFKTEIILMFTKDALVKEAILNDYPYLLISILGVYCFLYDGIFLGLKDYRGMRNSILVSLLISMPIFIYSYINQNNLYMWFGFILFFFSRSLFLVINQRSLLKNEYN